MQIDNFLPLDPEIEEIRFTKELAKSLSKLESLEDSLRKDLNSTAKRLKKATSELNNYHKIQKEVVRLYIQLINRDSDLVNKHDLAYLKEHVNRIESRISTQTEIYVAIKDLATNYKEYAKTLGEMGGTMSDLNKEQSKWHDAAANYSKVKHDIKVTGSKLERVEKSVRKGKKKVQKNYQERKHRRGFVEHAFQQVTQGWLKVKNAIRRMEW